ncbi:MAG TPA: winged helix-turn-helix domain-containing protein [Nitrososphaerales archaeon]|nr:winged helix-turn-helix domain-containing protein [Nitrososphaerales archaeon]
MKELQVAEKTGKNRTSTSTQPKKTKIINPVRSRAPTASACEIPILRVISRAPDKGVSTKEVLEEVRSAKWFRELNDDDRRARYPASGKKIVDSVIKFARKNLVMRGEIYPAGEGMPIGVWRITPRGVDMAAIQEVHWKPRYSTHDAVIIEEKKK